MRFGSLALGIVTDGLMNPLQNTFAEAKKRMGELLPDDPEWDDYPNQLVSPQLRRVLGGCVFL